MKQRAITGFLFVFVVVACVLLSQWTFMALALVIQIFCLLELFKMLSPGNTTNREVLIGCHVGALLILMFCTLYSDFQAYLPAAFLPLAIPVFSLVFQEKQPFVKLLSMHASGFFLISLPLAFFVQLPFACSGSYDFVLVLSLLIITWTHDTFAYLTGKFLGKHKLAPKISPGKTWEGTLGGFVFGSIAATILSGLFQISLPVIITFALVAMLFSNLGDLLESKLKRESGVKDSGNLLPGHGGFYDRFDALLGASIPVTIVILYVFQWAK